MLEFRKTFNVFKVNEADHTVSGIATEEKVDKAKEICDYADTAPYYKQWSEEIFNSTVQAGQEPSYGNIRLQHSMQIGGKATKIDYNDAAKQISLITTPVDDTVWTMIEKGFITGFSQGGNYIYRRCDACKTDIRDGSNYCPACEATVVVRYAASPAEVSYVDNPCLGTAHFTYVKADGTMEMRKLVGVETPPPPPSPKPSAKAKPSRSLPFPVGKKKGASVKKDMYQISCMARLLAEIRYLQSSCIAEGEYEDDPEDYALADGLGEWLADGVSHLKDLVNHETAELMAASKAAKGTTMTLEEIQKAAQSLKGHFGKKAAHHEKMAGHHKAAAESHADAQESHENMAAAHKARKGEGEDAEYHKAAHAHHTAKAAHHKSMSSHHEKVHKAHGAMAEHYAKMGDGCEMAAAGDLGKGAVAGTPAVVVPAVTEPVLGISAAEPLADTMKKAMTEAFAGLDLKKMVGDAVKEQTGDLNAAIKTAVGEAVKALPAPSGASAVPGTLVPRDETKTPAVAKAATTNVYQDSGL